jgi:hypothetical protein
MPPPTTTTSDQRTQEELTWFQLTLAELDQQAAYEREAHVRSAAARITTAYHADGIDTTPRETAEDILMQAEVVAVMERMDGFHAELAARPVDRPLLELAHAQDEQTLCQWRYAAVRLVDQRPPDWQAELETAEHEWRQAARERAGYIRAQAAIERAQQTHNPCGSPLATLERWACRLVHHRQRAELRAQLAALQQQLAPIETRCARLHGRLLALEARQADRLAWDADHTRTLAYATTAICVLGERGHQQFTLDQPDGLPLEQGPGQVAAVLRAGRQAARPLDWDAPPGSGPAHERERDGDDSQAVPVIPVQPDQAAAS